MHGRKLTNKLPLAAEVEKLLTSVNDKEKYICINPIYNYIN